MFFRNFYPALLWACLIFALTLIPGKYIPPVSIWDFASFDKLVHAGMFAVLIFLLLRGNIKQFHLHQFRCYAGAFTLCFIYGILLEVMQGFFIFDRHFDIFDIVANGAGCVLGIFVYKFA